MLIEASPSDRLVLQKISKQKKTVLLEDFAELVHFRLAGKQRLASVELGKNAAAAPDVNGCAVLVL